MRKLILAATAVVSVFGIASAEGYQINSLSARQIGMAHTGVALKLGAENMFFNPAGMAFMDKTLDLSGSVTGTIPTATATVNGVDFETDNKVSTPIGLHAAFSIYDNLKAGVSFYTPYGSSINWTDNWPGAVLNQNVDLKVFTVQPTVAWAITSKLSVGAGLMVSWGDVNLNKGLVSAATMDRTLAVMQQLGQLPQGVPTFGHTSPASVNLQGGTRLAVGVNLGAMYDINSRWTVGISFRSRMDMKVKAGDASIFYANQIAQSVLGESLDLLNSANFKAQMPCPWVLGLGVSYRPVDRLTLAFDARLTGWSAYKSLDIEFLSEQLTDYNQHITKDYKNAWCYSLGAEYGLTKRFDVRAGVMIDTTPVNDAYYNPETPGMTKIEPTVGLSFRPIPSLSIDFGFMYVAGIGKDNASCTYPDLLGGQMIKKLSAAGLPMQQIEAMGFAPEGRFTADYRLHAFSPSLGISYSF